MYSSKDVAAKEFTMSTLFTAQGIMLYAAIET